GFIENSLPILEENPRCLQVWLRAHDDTNGHPIESTLFLTRGVPWRKLAFDYNPPYCGPLFWHGFAFNPGLRRLQDYRAIGTYGEDVDFEFSQPGSAEAALSCMYKERGFYAAILADRSGTGYVRHIGVNRHVGAPTSLGLKDGSNFCS